MKSSAVTEVYNSKVSKAFVRASYVSEDLSIIMLTREGTKHIYNHLSADDAEELGKELVQLAKIMRENSSAS